MRIFSVDLTRKRYGCTVQAVSKSRSVTRRPSIFLPRVACQATSEKTYTVSDTLEGAMAVTHLAAE